MWGWVGWEGSWWVEGNGGSWGWREMGQLGWVEGRGVGGGGEVRELEGWKRSGGVGGGVVRGGGCWGSEIWGLRCVWVSVCLYVCIRAPVRARASPCFT